tara:strand:+ start:190 stop:450 length:261 start_codon:yes stop_codon:yes gene_type:complete
MGSLPIPDAGEAATVWINEVMLMLKDGVEPTDMEQGIESGLRAYFGQQSVKKKAVVELTMKACNCMRMGPCFEAESGSTETEIRKR